VPGILPLPNSAPDSLTPNHCRVPLPELVDVATTVLEEVVAVALVLDGATLDVGLDTAEVVAWTLDAIMLDTLVEVTGLESGTLDAVLDATRVDDELLEATFSPAVDMGMLETVALEITELLSAKEVERTGLDVGLDATTELLSTTEADRARLDIATELDTIILDEIVAE
jgi:hypothetical protein